MVPKVPSPNAVAWCVALTVFMAIIGVLFLMPIKTDAVYRIKASDLGQWTVYDNGCEYLVVCPRGDSITSQSGIAIVHKANCPNPIHGEHK